LKAELFKIVYLPCLRCGTLSVGFFAPKKAREFVASDLLCGGWDCEARHYLKMWRDLDGWRFIYVRDTRRYPAETYEDEPPPGLVTSFGDSHSDLSEDGDSNQYGPIRILRRKKYFTRDEIQKIHQLSHGKCSLCGKRWKLPERGKDGWHIDHMVPHSGGGGDTEEIQNFRVACARCNLKKGRGYTRRIVLAHLIRLLG